MEYKKSKTSRVKQLGLLCPLLVLNCLQEYITIDLINTLITKSSYNYIYIFINRFSKESFSLLCSRAINSKGITKLFLGLVQSKGYILTLVVFNKGPQFISIQWKEFYRIISIKVVLLTAFYKEINSQTEIIN